MKLKYKLALTCLAVGTILFQPTSQVHRNINLKLLSAE